MRRWCYDLSVRVRATVMYVRGACGYGCDGLGVCVYGCVVCMGARMGYDDEYVTMMTTMMVGR